MSETSIFTKIIKGDIPAYKVYEDERVLAFLDISPLAPGHTLVIPKVETDHLWDLDSELYLHVMSVAKQIAEQQRRVLNPKRVGIIVEGFEIPHAHVHVIPMNVGLKETVEQRPSNPSDNELAKMAEKLRIA